MKRYAFCIVSLVCVNGAAISEDWFSSDKGVNSPYGVAFSGCAPIKNDVDSKTIKLATLKAQANIAKSKNTSVSGHETSISSSQNSRYGLTVYESSEAMLKPVKILEKKIVAIDGVQQFCVLAVESDLTNAN